MSTTFFKIAAALGTAATAILTVFGFRQFIEKILLETMKISPDLSGPYLDIIIIMSGITLIVISPAFVIIGLAMRKITGYDAKSYFTNTSVSVCTHADLVEVYKMANDQFGPRASNMQAIERIFLHCPQVFWKVKSNKICGYFVLYPLTKRGESAIKSGHFFGASPEPSHIRKNIYTSKAVCVAAIVGLGTRGKAGALSGLTSTIQALKFDRVYGKAITPSGLRLVKDFEMKRVDGKEEYESNKYYIWENNTPPDRPSDSVIRGVGVAS